MAPPGRAPDGPRARFDDLAAGRSLVLEGFERAIVATAPEEVVEALGEADRAAAGGAWVGGFVSYEAASGLDPTLAVHPADAATPLVWFGVFREATADPLEPWEAGTSTDDPSWELDMDEPQHRCGVDAVRAAIAAGDVYQCNLTARYRAVYEGDTFDLYRRLAWAQRSAHCAYVNTGELAVASASPELFFEWTGDQVLTRPMKGTARRGRWAEEDRMLAQRLLTSEKERAENVMIVDLLRNDLGKVAEFGQVAVPALCSIERYESVWQLTSTITAQVRPTVTLVDLFRALFPSGSVTGAPKHRAMQVIADLEDGGRGVYCGAVGFVAPAGSPCRAQFSVAIRTAVTELRSRRTVYGSGGGIVWDSQPAAEFAELQTKAAVLSATRPAFDLLETMLVMPHEGVRRWERHRDRLLASAGFFGIDVDGATLEQRVTEAAATVGCPSILRLRVTQVGTIAVEIRSLEHPSDQPVRLEIDWEPVDVDAPWTFHKTTHRQPYETRRARHPGADQVVLVNPICEVTETDVANLAVQLDGRWWTPPVESGCLPGVLRAELLAEGELSIRRLTVADLLRSGGVAVLSSLRGWRRAVLTGDVAHGLRAGSRLPFVPVNI